MVVWKRLSKLGRSLEMLGFGLALQQQEEPERGPILWVSCVSTSPSLGGTSTVTAVSSSSRPGDESLEEGAEHLDSSSSSLEWLWEPARSFLGIFPKDFFPRTMMTWDAASRAGDSCWPDADGRLWPNVWRPSYLCPPLKHEPSATISGVATTLYIGQPSFRSVSISKDTSRLLKTHRNHPRSISIDLTR